MSTKFTLTENIERLYPSKRYALALCNAIDKHSDGKFAELVSVGKKYISTLLDEMVRDLFYADKDIRTRGEFEDNIVMGFIHPERVSVLSTLDEDTVNNLKELINTVMHEVQYNFQNVPDEESDGTTGLLCKTVANAVQDIYCAEMSDITSGAAMNSVDIMANGIACSYLMSLLSDTLKDAGESERCMPLSEFIARYYNHFEGDDVLRLGVIYLSDDRANLIGNGTDLATAVRAYATTYAYRMLI